MEKRSAADTVAIIFKVMNKATDLKPGESKVTKCPYCKGELFIEKSSYNQHIHARCKNCDFVFMQ